MCHLPLHPHSLPFAREGFHPGRNGKQKTPKRCRLQSPCWCAGPRSCLSCWCRMERLWREVLDPPHAWTPWRCEGLTLPICLLWSLPAGRTPESPAGALPRHGETNQASRGAAQTPRLHQGGAEQPPQRCFGRAVQR